MHRFTVLCTMWTHSLLKLDIRHFCGIFVRKVKGELSSKSGEICPQSHGRVELAKQALFYAIHFKKVEYVANAQSYPAHIHGNRAPSQNFLLSAGCATLWAAFLKKCSSMTHNYGGPLPHYLCNQLHKLNSTTYRAGGPRPLRSLSLIHI